MTDELDIFYEARGIIEKAQEAMREAVAHLDFADAALSAMQGDGWREQREICAKLAEAHQTNGKREWGLSGRYDDAAQDIAAAIRALPAPPKEAPA